MIFFTYLPLPFKELGALEDRLLVSIGSRTVVTRDTLQQFLAQQ